MKMYSSETGNGNMRMKMKDDLRGVPASSPNQWNTSSCRPTVFSCGVLRTIQPRTPTCTIPWTKQNTMTQFFCTIICCLLLGKCISCNVEKLTYEHNYFLFLHQCTLYAKLKINFILRKIKVRTWSHNWSLIHKHIKVLLSNFFK